MYTAMKQASGAYSIMCVRELVLYGNLVYRSG